jgi:hypothetical protein
MTSISHQTKKKKTKLINKSTRHYYYINNRRKLFRVLFENIGEIVAR